MALSTDTPEEVGLNSQRLKRLECWLEKQVESNRLQGASALISRRGKNAFFHATGDLRRDSVVRLFSMTKPVTTVAAMMLYEQGHFQLDDPLALYLPEFAHTPVWNGEKVLSSGATPDDVLNHVEAQQSPITIHHLLTHTSGLSYGFMNATPVDAYYRHHKLDTVGVNESLSSMVTRLAKAPLLAQPGTAWNYSVSTDVLGRLIEIWSGQSLADFMELNILQPLGMSDTGFYVKPVQQSRFTHLYGPAAGGELGAVNGHGHDSWQARVEETHRARQVLQPPVVLEPADASLFNNAPVLESGGGGLVGTIDDFSRFCQMLLNGGELQGSRLLSYKTVEYMRQNHLPDNKDMAAMGQAVWSETSYQGVGFGLGFAVVVDPVAACMITSKGEHHWGGAASTFFWIDPEEDMVVVFVTQLYPSSAYPLRRELRSLVYQALES